jgi:hypothetical protein
MLTLTLRAGPIRAALASVGVEVEIKNRAEAEFVWAWTGEEDEGVNAAVFAASLAGPGAH